MRNFIQNGDNIDCAAPYALASGSGVLIGPGLFGVAAKDCAQNAPGVFRTVGVFDINKDTVAVPLGAKLYWDAEKKQLTTALLNPVTNVNNTLVGAAVRATASASTTVRIRLNGVAI